MNIYSERLDFYRRLLVKEILEHTMKYGLAEDQHFYICFNINCNGILIPDSLLNNAHDNHAIILIRHDEYENLQTDDRGFSVDLMFERIQSIYVTYSSLVSFVDPSADFSLEFVPNYEPQIISYTPTKTTFANANNIILFPKIRA
jgi:hypothetical protein